MTIDPLKLEKLELIGEGMGLIDYTSTNIYTDLSSVIVYPMDII